MDLERLNIHLPNTTHDVYKLYDLTSDFWREWTYNSYDKGGKILTFKNSNEYWVKNTYDKYGNTLTNNYGTTKT
jgi:hypothetical protein